MLRLVASVVSCIVENGEIKKMAAWDAADCLRLFFEDGWLLILSDPAEPFIHIYSEAISEEVASSRANENENKVRIITGM